MSHLILTGFMGCGKSTVGRALSQRLGLPFADCDTEIEVMTGKTIPEIFEQDGEQVFRQIESRALASLLERESSVLALGGGALCSAENLALAKRYGPVICLSAEPVEILQRVSAQPGQRPLLKVADPLAKIRDILNTRQACYNQADVQVDTTHLEPDGVVEEVLDWLNRVRVNLDDRSYDIHVEDGCHAWIGRLLADLPSAVTSVALISNRAIDRHFGDAVRASLDDAGLKHHTLLVPAGERYKSLETAGRLFGDLIRHEMDRKSVIIALGGGVIGDLAGFVAASYQRGVRFAQIPTSLLAQVDSSVGGKVGVNHALGKNMIGAFLQPQTVLIDPKSLHSLPPRELRSGLAEVVKYGVIWDENFFSFLEKQIDGILRLDPQTMKHVIRRSCQIKALVVEQDERESGLRAILNYGHTVGHAVETSTRYERYTHGEGVAIGMVVAARIAHAMGLLRAEPVHRIIRLLEMFGLPTHLPKGDPANLIKLMRSDKKAVSGQVRFVLPVQIGRVELVNAVPDDILLRAMKESMEM